MRTHIIKVIAIFACVAVGTTNTIFAQITPPEKYVQVGETNTDVHLKLKGQDNDTAMEWDDGKAQLRHHYNTFQTTRGWLRLYLDANNTLNNEEFSIFRDTLGVMGYDVLPELRFQLDGGTSWINSGNFGIGLNAPSAMLHVNSMEGTDPLRIQYNGATKLRIFQNGSVSIGTNNSNVSTDDVYIHNSLGIGVSQPQERLELNGAIRIGNSTTNTNGVIRFANGIFEGRTGNQWRSLMEDNDSDPANELQSLIQSGTLVTLSDGGGSISVADADANPNNEIQSLVISGNLLSITGGNSVSLPSGGGSGGTRIEDTDGDTFIDTEINNDDDQVNIELEGQSSVRFARSSSAQKTYISFPNNDGNILIGASGALTANFGTDNIYIGSGTSAFNQTGSENVMIGNNVGTLNNAQLENVYIGNDVAIGNAGDYNVTLGYQAGSTDFYSSSVVIGYQAGQNMTSRESVLIGYQAGQNMDNAAFQPAVCIGYKAGNSLRGATGNTLIGFESGQLLTQGENTYIGWKTGAEATSSQRGTIIGYDAGSAITTGDENTLLGSRAGPEITSGYSNTSIGRAASLNMTTGYENTCVGRGAGTSMTTGFRNTYLGVDAGPTSGALNNSTAIGFAALTTADLQIRIGATNINSIGGYSGWSNVSDGRFKTNVREDVPGLAFITALRPVTYSLDALGLEYFLRGGDAENMDKDYVQTLQAKGNYIYSGFIAQEVEEAAENLGYDFSGVDRPSNGSTPYALRYAEFVVPLVKATQELSDQNEELRRELAELKAENAELRSSNAELGSSIEAIHSALQANGIQVMGKAHTSSTEIAVSNDKDSPVTRKGE